MKQSIPETVCPLRTRCSLRCEPMNPAAPVTRQRTGRLSDGCRCRVTLGLRSASRSRALEIDHLPQRLIQWSVRLEIDVTPKLADVWYSAPHVFVVGCPIAERLRVSIRH